MPVRPHQIIIKGDPVLKEGIATQTITPGDLIDLAAGSAATGGTYITPYLRKHNVPGGNAQKAFALNQDYIGGGIDKNYNTNDQVFYGVFRQGDEVFARIAANETVVYGTYLESNGDGTLRAALGGSAAAAQDNRYVARALEPSAANPLVARLIVEVL